MVIKKAAVPFCTSHINHILIFTNIPKNPLSFAELLIEIYGGRKKKKKKRKKGKEKEKT